MSTPEELIKKYGDKTPEQMEQEQEDLETEVNVNAKALDQEIQKYSDKTDDLMSPDGKKLAVVRRPTAAQFKRFTPPELAKFAKNPEKIAEHPELAMKYEQDIFKLMEELIVSPKHTAAEWQELIGDDFVALFQAHIFKTRQKLADTVKSFL